MKKVARNRDGGMAVPAVDLRLEQLQRVRGGATAIEYALLVAPTTSTDAVPLVIPPT